MNRLPVDNSFESPVADLSGKMLEWLPFLIEIENGLFKDEEHFSQAIQFRRHVGFQLQMLKQALGLMSATVLWKNFDGRLQTYSWSSAEVPRLGPFADGEGIFGVFKDRDEVAISHYRDSSPAIPYLSPKCQAGSFIAKVLSADEGRHNGLLCLIKASSTQWDEAEKMTMRQCASLLCSEFAQVRNHFYADFERQTLQRVFEGLRKLNSTLGLSSVYKAADAAINSLVEADLIAISVVKDNHHRFEYVSGNKATLLNQNSFSLDDSIVGQVVKYRCTLPDLSNPRSSAPVVQGVTLFDRYPSIMVVPLCRDDGPVAAVLIIAGKKRHQFSRNCQEMIEMIAAQLAIKIDLAHSHEQINAMTLKDSLTGIANRRAFDTALSSMNERSKRRNSSFSLVLCDIDLFKSINDTYGHPFGDEVIKQVAQQLSSVVRSGDLAARIGGEEFALLLEGADARGAIDVAERARNNISGLKMHQNGKPVGVTISLGVAVSTNDLDMEGLLQAADHALYQAKQGGRNRSVCS